MNILFILALIYNDFFLTLSLHRCFAELRYPYKQKFRVLRDPWPHIDPRTPENFKITLSKFISEIIERFILLKLSPFGYWDNVNIHSRVVGFGLSSVLISVPIVHIVSIWYPNIPDHLPTIFFTVFGTLFWQERASYYEKWKYLAALYNDIVKATPFVLGRETVVNNHFSYRKSLELAFVQDIVTMEMWSHSSYFPTFYKNINEALNFVQKKNPERVFSVSDGLSKSQILDLLEEYQDEVMKDEKSSFKDSVYLKISS